MKTRTINLGIQAIVIATCTMYACTSGTPGDAVKAAMEKEIIKEKAQVYLEEYNVPAVIVKKFEKTHSDTITRQWLVYKKTPEEVIKVQLPEIYIVRYNKKGQEYSMKYSDKGEILETNRLINLSVLPDPAREMFQKGEYKEWDIVGDVFEILDNITGESAGYIVTVEKTGNKERVFFNRAGKVVKIQKISPS